MLNVLLYASSPYTLPALFIGVGVGIGIGVERKIGIDPDPECIVFLRALLLPRAQGERKQPCPLREGRCRRD
jgi:hypothetical protein